MTSLSANNCGYWSRVVRVTDECIRGFRYFLKHSIAYSARSHSNRARYAAFCGCMTVEIMTRRISNYQNRNVVRRLPIKCARVFNNFII